MRHVLTDIDEALREAECSFCGKVTIRIRERNNDGSINWRCTVADNSKPSSRHRPGKRHHRPKFISKAEYEQALEVQKNLCAICHKPQNGKRLAADHCHRTNSKRGLLCQHCNMGLGLFKDNPELLLAAIAYLRRYAAL